MKFLSGIIGSFKRVNPDNLLMPANSYLFLEDECGNKAGGIIAFSSELKSEIINSLDNQNSDTNSNIVGKVSSTIIDKLGSVGTTIASGVQAGNLMQIVAPPEVIEGLASGTMRLMETATGNTGSVIRQGASQIFRQARFAPANIAPIVAPVMIYQLLNAVAGAYQLSKINARLDSLQRTIEEISFRQQANSYGRLFASINALEDINKEYKVLGKFTDDMRMRLSIATQEIQVVNYELGLILMRFQQKSEEIQKNNSKFEGAKKADTFLNENLNIYMLDAKIYLAAAKAGLMAQQAWILHDMQFAPEYITTRLEDLQEDVLLLQQAIDPMRKMCELQEYAESCFYETNALKRMINPGLKKRIQDREDYFDGEQSITKTAMPSQSISIWQDGNGEIQVVASSNCISE